MSNPPEQAMAGSAAVVTGLRAVHAKNKPAPPSRLYATAAEWVDAILLDYVKDVHMPQWCAYWADHTGAARRIEALWASWEIAQQGNGSDQEAWIRLALDHHVAHLTAAYGPFRSCSGTTHKLPPSTNVVTLTQSKGESTND